MQYHVYPKTMEILISLFNGKDLTNWTLEKPGGFEVIDGELITRSFGAGNDIFTNKVVW